ncbi:amidohydrolase family protein [Erythromicrobium ramosum]|uniref:Amidohydrolase family protein n=3 Tax=Erythrobacter ramosus TaxID=35811 RepID=A0A6I4UIJ3_9SPHN|nr:amidohydrolase family protein [Erythrobacter ramosus]
MPKRPSAAPLAMSRRTFGAGVLAALAGGSALAMQSEPLTVISGGRIADGSGGPLRDATIVVRGRRILHVRDPRHVPETPDRVIDATGMIVAPGFIDLHAHGDPLEGPQLASLRQGVTTIVVGQDGRTPGPFFDDGITLPQWMQRVAAQGSHVHVAALSGHGTNRMRSGAKFALQATPQQLGAAIALLREDMAAGAFGMSTALEYEPGRFTPLDELVELAEIVGAGGGVVMSHLRSEDSDRIDGSIDELIAQGRKARVHASHLKIVYGHDPLQAVRIIEKLRGARRRGVKVTADAYPYNAGFGNLALLYPDWISDARTWDTALATRREETMSYIAARIERRGTADAILIGTGPDAGKTLSQVGSEKGVSAAQAVIDYGYGGPGAAHFIIDAKVQEVFIIAPDTGVGSDGAPSMRHPRAFGTFPRALQTFRERGLPTERAVHKMTGLAADIIGLEDRGVIRSGAMADLVIFDPIKVNDNATWSAPDTTPSGIAMVMLEGSVALDQGREGPPCGRVLRKGLPSL